MVTDGASATADDRLTPTQRLVLALLCGDVGGALESPDTAVDWEDVLTATRRVHGFIAWRIDQSGARGRVPPDAMTRLEEARRLGVFLHLQRHRMLAKALGALRAAGISPIVLKGAALAHSVFPRPELRSMADLDFWVLPSEMDAATAALSADGFGIPYRHSIAPAVEGHRVLEQAGAATLLELHAQPDPLDDFLSVEQMESMRSRAVSCDLGGIRALVLAPEDLLLQVCLHASHQHHFDLGLRPFLDAALLVEAQGDAWDWRALAERFSTNGTGVWMAIVLGLARDLLSAPVPDTFFASLPDIAELTEMKRIAGDLMLSHRRGSRVSFLGDLAAVPTLRGRVAAIVHRATSHYQDSPAPVRLRRMAFDLLVKTPRHLQRIRRGHYGAADLERRRVHGAQWAHLRGLVEAEQAPE